MAHQSTERLEFCDFFFVFLDFSSIILNVASYKGLRFAKDFFIEIVIKVLKILMPSHKMSKALPKLSKIFDVMKPVAPKYTARV